MPGVNSGILKIKFKKVYKKPQFQSNKIKQKKHFPNLFVNIKLMKLELK